MKYFTFLPIIQYDNDIYTIRNLFFKPYFFEDIPNKYLYQYTIKDGENLESISFDVFNDSSYWWILAMINDIRDIIFDLPLESSTLQKIASSQSMVGGELDLILFSENYDVLETENDLKRNLKILKPIYLNTILNELINKT